MITIYTLPQRIADIEALIRSQQNQMEELVVVKDLLEEKPTNSGYTIIVNSKGICFPIDWYNVQPPFLLPESLWYQDEVLLAVIYARLGNMPASYELLASHGALQAELHCIAMLREEQPLNPQLLAVETYQEFDDYRLMHNHAIVRHYTGNYESGDDKQLHYYYNAALDAAPSPEYQAFTTKQYIVFLLDAEKLEQAEKIALQALGQPISADAQAELQYLLVQIGMRRLSVPYDGASMEQLKDRLWNVLQTYERQHRALETALLLMDAAHIATISKSFSEALGYIQRAIRIFEEEQQPELGFEALYKKSILLYTWAGNGQPQFFRSAAESFQQALRYFTKADFPEIYAEIQHYLGVIYSEIPDEVKKKSIWAAVSTSSFQEALSLFNKTDAPYQYAMVCNSYGNALTKYPAAIHSDNFEKALFYYNEALDIRTPHDYPVERVLTLLNYIEASWHVGNADNGWNPERYEDMESKVAEVSALSNDPEILKEVHFHQEKLRQLKKGFDK